MGRNGSLEYARLIAAFGIVFFHAKAPGASVGYAALPFFVILLIVMAFPAAEKQAFGTYIKGRANRLLIPWLIWSGIYGALKLIEVVLTGVPLSSEFNITMLLTGPALHLWFLPFAFVACVMVHPVTALIRQGFGVGLPVAFVAAALAIIILQQAFDIPKPFSQWCYGLPAVLLGLALASWPASLGARALVLLVFGALALLIGATAGLSQLAFAAAAYLLCIALPSPDTKLARQAGAAAMGVYLAHPLILSILTRSTSLPERSLSLAIAACIGALGLTLAITALQTARQHGGFISRRTA